VKKYILGIVVSCLSAFMLCGIVQAESVTPEQYLKTIDMTIDLSKDETLFIPRLFIGTTDFTTGIETKEVETFEELAIPRSVSWRLGSQLILQTPQGLKAYLRFDASFTLLYEYDFTTHSLRELRRLPTGASEHDDTLRLYSYQRAYGIKEKENNKTVYSMYSLDDGRLLGKSYNAPRFSYWKVDYYNNQFLNPNLLFWNKVDQPFSEIYYSEGFGPQKKSVQLPLHTEWVIRVGKKTFTQKIADRRDVITVTENGKTTALLDKPGVHGMGLFSPNEKYFIFSEEYTKSATKDKTIIRVYDIKQGKIVKSIQTMYAADINDLVWFGDDVIVIEHWFSSPSTYKMVYYHLPTGISSIAQNERSVHEFKAGSYYYHVDEAKLLSYANPIRVTIDGVQLKYTGQGAFRSGSDKLIYVPLQDFVASAGGTVVEGNGNYSVTIKGKTAVFNTKDDKQNIRFGNTLFISAKKLSDTFSYFLRSTDLDTGHHNDRISLESIDSKSLLNGVTKAKLTWGMELEQLLALFPKSEKMEDGGYTFVRGYEAYFTNNRLNRVVITEQYYLTEKGIQIGNSPNLVKKRYSEKEAVALGSEQQQQQYDYGDESIQFNFHTVDYFGSPLVRLKEIILSHR